jgi:hypothetical protein
MQTLPGLGWFNDDTFVLAAGLAEAALGAMLISGFAPRLVILAMWLPFNLGIPVLPSQELLGHLPILGIMYVLLVQGSAPVQTTSPRPARFATVTPATRVGGAPGGVLIPTAHSTDSHVIEESYEAPRLVGSR